MTMTPDGARAALETTFIAAWATAHPTVPYFLAGVSEPDLNTQAAAFVMFEVSVPRIEQSGLNGATPPKRYYGDVSVGIFIPEGSGTKSFFDMQSTIENSLCITTISGIVLQGMRPFKRTPAIGWQGRHLEISYHFDSLP